MKLRPKHVRISPRKEGRGAFGRRRVIMENHRRKEHGRCHRKHLGRSSEHGLNSHRERGVVGEEGGG